MTFQTRLLCAIAGVSLAALAVTAPAQALTMRECVEKYKAVRNAGTLKGTQGSGRISARPSLGGTEATPAAAPAPAAPKATK